jgi:hypothetical protein
MNRASRHDLPTSIASDLTGELGRLGGQQPGTDFLSLLAAWPAAVGEAISRNAWPARSTRDGTLIVHTSSSAWAAELTQLVGTVRERLGDHAPEKLRFLVGPLPQPGPPSESITQRSPPRPGAATLIRAREIAGSIENDALRAAAERAAAAALSASQDDPATTVSDIMPHDDF